MSVILLGSFCMISEFSGWPNVLKCLSFIYKASSSTLKNWPSKKFRNFKSETPAWKESVYLELEWLWLLQSWDSLVMVCSSPFGICCSHLYLCWVRCFNLNKVCYCRPCMTITELSSLSSMHIFKDILPLGWIIAHFKCYICICVCTYGGGREEWAGKRCNYSTEALALHYKYGSWLKEPEDIIDSSSAWISTFNHKFAWKSLRKMCTDI